jgi:protein O-GlcNAc transferase
MPADDELRIAVSHHNAGRTAEALAAYQRILAREPDHAQALQMLGMLAAQCRQFEPAAELIRQALRVGPENAEAHNNLGNVLRELGRLDEAAAEYRRAVQLKPNYAGAYRNLANVHHSSGRPDLALQSLRKAIELAPASAEIHSSLLYMLHFHPDYDSAAILGEHRRWAERHARPVQRHPKPFGNSREPERRIRVGYVSPDFRNHVAGRMFKPLLAHHDHQRFEIVCYADVAAPDLLTAELKSMADQWHWSYQVPDDQLAADIRRHGIDILVDLAQHTGGNRMLLFARKPAPVQVSWLGYPSTTGLDAIDYRLTDPFLDPPGEGDENYSERSYRLPHSFWCYQPPDAPSDVVVALPEDQNGFVTFGCMNRFEKVTPPALALWRRVLQAVGNSRLRMHSEIGAHLDSVRAFFREENIADERVIFVERQPIAKYPSQYHSIDICLDPLPFGGGTTTCDALWMGVPVVTLAGRTAVGRGGVSILSNVGLEEFIARSGEQYVSIAAALAADRSHREHLRRTLRGRLEASPLMDGRRFAAEVEAAFRQIWRTLCESPCAAPSKPQ